MSPRGRLIPWTTAQLRLFTGLTIAALLLLAMSVESARTTSALSHQVVPLNLAVVSAIIAGLADALWLVQGRRAVIARTRQLLIETRSSSDERRAPLASMTSEPIWVAVAAGSRAHRPGCLLVAGKATRNLSNALIDQGELRRCEVCGC
jgi:hypothetical protein